MAFPEIGITAIAEMADFARGVTEYTEGISTMQKAGEKMVKVGGTLTKAVTAPILGIGAAALALAVEASKLDKVRDGFTKFAESVGVDAVDALNQMRKATKGLIPDIDLMQISNKALAGSSDAVKKAFLENLPAIQKFALRASQVQGIPLDITLDKFVTGLKRMSPQLIDDTGLTLKLSEVTEKASEIFGKTAKELSKEEQQLALLRVVSQKMEPEMRALGDVQIGFAEKTAIATTKAKNLKQQIGTALIPVVEALFDSIGDLTGEISGLQGGIVKTVTEFIKANPKIVKMALAFAGIAAAVGPVLIVVGKVVAILGALNPIVLLVAAAVGIFVAIWKKDFLGIQGKVSAVLKELPGLFQKVTKAITDIIEIIRSRMIPVLDALKSILAPAVSGVSKSVEKIKFIIQLLVDAVVDGFQKGGIRGAIDSFLKAWGAFGDNLIGLLKSIQNKIIAVLQLIAGKVIDWIKEQSVKFAQQLTTWGVVFVEWLSPRIAELLVMLRSFASGIVVWIAGQIPIIRAKLAEWGEAFVAWIGPQIPPLLAKLGKLYIEMQLWMLAQVAKITTQLAKWGLEFVAWVGPRIGELLSKLGKLSGDVLKWIGQQIPPLVQRLREWGDELVAWIQPQIPILLQRLGELTQEVLAWLVATIPILADRLLSWAAVFIQWIGPMVPVVLTKLGEFLGAIIEWILGTGVPLLLEKTLLLAQILVDWIIGSIPAARTGLEQFLLALGDFIREDLIPGIISFGTEIVEGLVNGIVTGVAKSQEILQRLGPDIVAGLQLGLENAWGALQEKIDELVARIPEAIRKFLGISSPSTLFADIGFDMALGLALGFQEGISEQDLTFANAIAETVSSISDALVNAFDAFKAIGGFGGVAREAVELLVSDIEFVLVLVRTQLLDLWGWAGASRDTVWGHMIFWADAVSGIVELVGDAVAVFKSMEGFTGVMPGVINLVILDIQKVLNAVVGVDVGIIDESLVEWVEFSADIVSAVTGIIDDLQTLAALEGPLNVQLNVVESLVDALVTTVSTVGSALDGFDLEIQSLDKLKAEWLEFSTGIISTIADVIDDLGKLATFEGPLAVELDTVKLLVKVLVLTISTIGTMLDGLDLEIGAVDKLKADWVKFAGDLIGTLVSVIDDLEALAKFKGSLVVQQGAVKNLVLELDVTARTILDAVGEVADQFDEDEDLIARLKGEWLGFAAGLISTVAGAIEDLKTLAAFTGGLTVSAAAVANLVATMKQAVTTILLQLVRIDLTDADRQALEIRDAWLSFAASMISTVAGVVEDLETLAAFEGGLTVSSDAVRNLVSVIKQTITTILLQLVQIDLTDADREALEMRDAWASFAASIIATFAGVVEDLKTLADFRGGLVVNADAVRNLVATMKQAISVILIELGNVILTDKDREAMEMRSAWADFATAMISTFAGVVEDLKTLAAFEGGLSVSAGAVINLVATMKDAISIILIELGNIILTDKDREAMEMRSAWAEFATAMISTFAGVVEDLKTLADFKGGLTVQSSAVVNLVFEMKKAISIILTNLGNIILTDKDREAMEMRNAWAEFATAMISTFAGVVEDLKTIADFKGGLAVSAAAVINLVASMKQTISVILTEFGQVVLTDADREAMEMKDAWASFATAMISTFAGAIEDLKTLATFKGGLTVSSAAVVNLVATMKEAIGIILAEFGRVVLTDANREAMEMKDAWASFATAMISTFAGVVEDLKTLADFKGGLAINTGAVTNLVDEMEVAIQVILDSMADVTGRFDQEGNLVDELKAKWAEFTGGLISSVAGAIEDMKAIALLEGELVVNADALASVVAAMNAAVDAVIAELGGLEDFDTDAMEAAQTFAETAGAVVSLLSSGVEAFAALKDFKDVPAKALKALAAGISLAVKEIHAIAVKFASQGTAIQDTKIFADGAAAIFEFISTAIEALGGLAEFQGVSTRVFVMLRRDIEEAIDILSDLAVTVDTQALTDAQEFAEAMNTVLGFVQGALEVLTAIGQFTGIGQVWQELKNDIEDAFEQLPAITDIVQSGEQTALDFKTAIENVMGDVRDGFTILSDLTGVTLPDWPVSELQVSLDELSGLGAVAVSQFSSNITGALSLVSDAFNLVLGKVKTGVLAIQTTLEFSFENVGFLAVETFASNTANDDALTLIRDAFIDLLLKIKDGVLNIQTMLSLQLWDAGFFAVEKFAAGVVDATDQFVRSAFTHLALAVADGVAGVNAELDALGMTGAADQGRVAAAGISGGGQTFNQTFNVSPTVSGNTFQVREESDIDLISGVVLEAMREELGDITSRTIRTRR